MCPCVSVWLCVREKETKGDREKERQTERGVGGVHYKGWAEFLLRLQFNLRTSQRCSPNGNTGNSIRQEVRSWSTSCPSWGGQGYVCHHGRSDRKPLTFKEAQRPTVGILQAESNGPISIYIYSFSRHTYQTHLAVHS